MGHKGLITDSTPFTGNDRDEEAAAEAVPEKPTGARAMASYWWANLRITTGIILGGVFGFYVMHRVETSYKERMKERVRQYEQELKRKEQQRQQDELLSDP